MRSSRWVSGKLGKETWHTTVATLDNTSPKLPSIQKRGPWALGLLGLGDSRCRTRVGSVYTCWVLGSLGKWSGARQHTDPGKSQTPNPTLLLSASTA